MKAFARLFFALGLLTALLLFVFPDALKFVSIPADDSVLRKAAGGSAPPAGHSEKSVETQPEVPAVIERVELVVNGVSYQFQLASLDTDYVYAQAKAFCLSHAASQSMSESALESGCTQVVLNNLIQKVNEKRAAEVAARQTDAAQSSQQQASTTARDPTSTIYQVNVPVTNGKTYAISFDAAIHSPYDVSNHFCRENAVELGLESETHVIQGCVPSVGKYIADQLESMGYVRAPAPVDAVATPAAQEAQQQQQVQEVSGDAPPAPQPAAAEAVSSEQ